MNRFVDRKWIKERWTEAGFKSQEDFAQAVGLTGPKLSNSMKGIRRVQADEIDRMAKALSQTYAAIARAFSVQMADPLLEAVLKIVASVEDGDFIKDYDEHADDFGSEEIEIPFIGYSGNGIAVKTEGLSPRYLRGEVIASPIWHDERGAYKPEELVGQDVIVRLVDGRKLLKTLHSGSKKGSYALISLNARIPPVFDAEIEWLTPIDFHVPRIAIR